MKKNILSVALIAAFSIMSTNTKAQSLKDLFSKENLSKVVNTVTGHTAPINMTGNWNYISSAVEFESANLLMKAGGAAAATVAEGKMNEQLEKIGIKKGQMNFNFKADSTFTSTVANHSMNGTYSYNASTKQVTLTYLKIINMSAKVNYSSNKMELLFNSDKLLKLLTFIGSKSNNTAIKSVSSLADNYDGMMLGFELKK